MPMTCLVPAQADHSPEAALAKNEPPWLGWFQSTCALEQTLWDISQRAPQCGAERYLQGAGGKAGLKLPALDQLKQQPALPHK